MFKIHDTVTFVAIAISVAIIHFLILKGSFQGQYCVYFWSVYHYIHTILILAKNHNNLTELCYRMFLVGTRCLVYQQTTD